MEIKEFVENIKWYKGNAAAHKELSASKIGSDMLPLYLAKTAKPNAKKIIGSAYIGNAFHQGMDYEMVDSGDTARFGTETLAHKKLPNGWIITGTADVLDYEKKNVHDYKTLSAGSYKKKKAEVKDKNSQISMQMGTLMWLNNFGGKAYAEFFITDLKPWRKDHPANGYQQHEVITYNHTVIETIALKKTNELQEYIDKKILPPECKDVMWMSYEGNKIKLKCEYYCDYSDACPYFNSHAAKKKNTLSTIQGW